MKKSNYCTNHTFDGSLNQHCYFKHTVSTTLPWLWPVNSDLSYGSYLTWQHCHFWRKKKSFSFLLDLYLYFPNIPRSSRDQTKLCVESLYPTHLQCTCGYHCSSHAFPVYAKYTIISYVYPSELHSM
jgi:hypothetical protein